MGLKLSNFARAKLATPPSGTGGLSFTVESGKGALFPTLGAGDYVYLVLKNATKTNNEIVKVEARSGDAFTIASGGRGADGTTAQTWTANDYVECCLTNAALIEVFNAAVTALGALTPAADKAPYFTGASAAGLFDIGAYMRGSGFLSAADAPGARTAIGAFGSAGGTLSGNVTITTSDDGAVLAPSLSLIRVSASPAANDEIGSFQVIGRNDAAGSVGYGLLQTVITSPVAGAERSKVYLRVYSGGAGVILLSAVGGTTLSNGMIEIGSPAAAAAIGEKLLVETGIATSSSGGTHKGVLGDFGVGAVLIGAYTSSAVKIITNNATRLDIHATDGTVDIAGGSGKLKIGGAITRFQSSAQTFTNGTSQGSVAHGGPRVPDLVTLALRCKTGSGGEGGYSEGDEIHYASWAAPGTGFLSVWADASNIGYALSTALTAYNKSSSGSFVPSGSAWEIIMRAHWL